MLITLYLAAPLLRIAAESCSRCDLNRNGGQETYWSVYYSSLPQPGSDCQNGLLCFANVHIALARSLNRHKHACLLSTVGGFRYSVAEHPKRVPGWGSVTLVTLLTLIIQYPKVVDRAGRGGIQSTTLLAMPTPDVYDCCMPCKNTQQIASNPESAASRRICYTDDRSMASCTRHIAVIQHTRKIGRSCHVPRTPHLHGPDAYVLHGATVRWRWLETVMSQ